jgi:hypothetical protein
MRTFLAFLFGLMLVSGVLLAGEAPPPPAEGGGEEGGGEAAAAAAKYLEEAAGAWFSAARDGMQSVLTEAKVDVEGTGWGGEGKDAPPGKWDRALKLSGLDADWSWSDVGGQQIHLAEEGMRGKARAVQRQIDKLAEDVWRGVAGTPYGPFPDRFAPALVEEGSEKRVEFTHKKKTVTVLRFSASTSLPLALEEKEGKRTKVTRFGFGKEGEKTVLKNMQVTTEVGTEMKGQTTFTWDGFRKVNGRPLPTVARIDLGTRTIAFRFTYTRVNGKPADVEKMGKAEVKDLAKVLSDAFKSGSLVEKQEAIRAAVDAGNDKAALLLSKFVYDKEAGVEVAKALGKMGKTSAVPALVSAFSKTRKNRELHEAVIWALGEIGDPRAVKVLSANIWGGAGSEGWRETARLRIRALGKIRHVSAVDQLVDMSDDSRRRWGQALRGEVYSALKSLTGMHFRSSREWKDWWKKNRSRFRF